MKLEYYLTTRKFLDRDAVVLDGGIGGAGRKATESKLQFLRDHRPGTDFTYMAVSLHWAEDDSWQKPCFYSKVGPS